MVSILDPPETSYVVIVDAGSSGTRPYIYKYREQKAVPGHFESSDEEETKISLFYNAKVTEVVRDNGTGAAGNEDKGIHKCFKDGGDQRASAIETYLEGLLTEVKDMLGKQGVIDEALKNVSFFFYGTGGVRTLSAGDITELYGIVKAIIQASGFGDLKNEKLDIDGATEAKFGWVAANYSQGYPVSDYRVYVEMGGASAQIAIPVPLYQGAALNIEKGKAEAALETALQNVHQAADESEKEKLQWEVHAASAYVEALGNPAVQLGFAEERAEDINKGEPHKRVARVEHFEGRDVFLASFPMGVDDGYERYKIELAALGNNKPPILPDPSRRQGYRKTTNVEIHGRKWTEIQGMVYRNGDVYDTETLVTQSVQHAIITFKTTNDDGTIAHLGVPSEKRFRNLLGLNPQVIGASGFWHNTRLGGDKGYTFDFEQHLSKLKLKRNEVHNDGHNKYYINNFFAGIWMREVLKHGFDIKPESVVFTPYNGHNGRLNWTLGAAVLCASPDLTNLGDGMDICCKIVE